MSRGYGLQTVSLNLTQLPDEKKRFAWEWLQTNRPEIAELLKDDIFKHAQKAFGGDIIIDLEPSDINDMKKKFAEGPQAGV